MTPEVAELRERLRYDTPFWAGGVTRDHEGRWIFPGPQSWKGCARIVNKDKLLVPLIATPWQLELDDILERQRKAGLPMRVIILKARQLGFSTWVQAKITQRVTQFPYMNATIVAHEVEAAGKLFDMAKRMHAHLPTEQELGLGFNIKPDIIGLSDTNNGRKHIEFGERSRRLREQGRTGSSMLSIDTANTPQSGRADTRNIAHLSEVGLWPDAATSGTDSKMISMLNSVPYRPETLVVLESTARGLNHFYRRWVSACEGEHDPDTGETYATLFVPWWREPQYAMEFATHEDRERFVLTIGTGPYGEDEAELMEAHGCTPEQLRWRRMQIRTQHEDNIDLFHQEYPATPEEAFIGSGRTVFSGILVGRAIREAEACEAPVQGTLRGEDFVERKTRAGTIRLPREVLWVPVEDMQREEPMLEVWEQPVTKAELELLPMSDRPPPGAYVVAVDAAEGEANTFTEGDFHAVQVFDHRSRKQVAVHESRMDIHLMPMWVYLIALYYNTAWLAPEINGPGIAISDPLQKDYRYPRMYRRRRFDTMQDDVESKPGWKTDKVTKPLLESGFGAALQDATHGLRHPRTARQLNTYVIDDKGRHGAQEGEHDDLLMAAMIAHKIMDVLLPPRVKGQRTIPRDVDSEITGY